MVGRRSMLMAFVACVQLVFGGAFAPPMMMAGMMAGSPPVVAHHAARPMMAHHHAGMGAEQAPAPDQHPCHTNCCDHCAACLGAIHVPLARVGLSLVITVASAEPPRASHALPPGRAPPHRQPFALGPPSIRI